eukprot:CAMPEP_0178420608 /NCGR_PEP_ID=MMETSP0689_2-20121128/26221_1 /TAXON_ID=160604 /ORGANISM="Amphidinium massartii, Strain CS-259" /LENGTH=174 /DNA_ID=CAMNT_0020042097 /DNA_START=63 /DNA_END=587 /DNA_ORIENTATION=+
MAHVCSMPSTKQSQGANASTGKALPRQRRYGSGTTSRSEWRQDSGAAHGRSFASPASSLTFPADASTEPGSEADDEWSSHHFNEDDSSDDEGPPAASFAALLGDSQAPEQKSEPAFPAAEVRTAEWRQVGLRLASVFRDLDSSDSDVDITSTSGPFEANTIGLQQESTALEASP